LAETDGIAHPIAANALGTVAKDRKKAAAEASEKIIRVHPRLTSFTESPEYVSYSPILYIRVQDTSSSLAKLHTGWLECRSCTDEEFFVAHAMSDRGPVGLDSIGGKLVSSTKAKPLFRPSGDDQHCPEHERRQTLYKEQKHA
jgi:hypothetical protein